MSRAAARVVMIAVAVVGAAGGMSACATGGHDATASNNDTVSGCTITDGDTIRCGAERVRLLGIDAPELPGHCRAGRVCAPGDPYASSDSLREAMSGTMQIERVGTDRYGRTLAMIAGKHGDLSCWQLRHARAIYKPKWDDGGRVMSTCPAARDAQ